MPDTLAPYRLGFAVKVLGDGGLPSADTRRWQSGPHLRRSIEYLLPVVDRLEAIDVRVYRLSSNTIPYGTHPDLPQLDFRRQLDEAAPDVAALRGRVLAAGLRLSTHPGQYTVLNGPDEEIRRKAILDLEADAALLEALGQGPEATIVVHVGGRYDDRSTALDRWVATFERLPDAVRSRLGLENDERSFGLRDVLEVHRRTGVRLVLDVHHHAIHPDGREIPLPEALRLAAATWPDGIRPKIHLSSVRTMLGTEERPRVGRRGVDRRQVVPPLSAHADLVSPWDLERVVRAAGSAGVVPDVMLEAKGKDLALLAVRRAVAEVAPDVAAAEERRAPA
jgi:UV DNA damage endonuclease